MTVSFDAATGRLRLGRTDADRLISWSAGEGGVEGPDDSWVAAGIVRDGRPHPAVSPQLQALVSPVCSLDLHVDGVHVARGGVVPGLVGLLLSRPDVDVCELVALAPEFLAPALAQLVRLGPRRRSGQDPQLLSARELDELMARDDHTRWAVEASWTAPPGRTTARGVDVVDHSPVGIWLVERSTDGVLLWPTTPTAVWRALTVLLPADDELDQAPVVRG